MRRGEEVRESQTMRPGEEMPERQVMRPGEKKPDLKSSWADSIMQVDNPGRAGKTPGTQEMFQVALQPGPQSMTAPGRY